jgi:hypothetical protein
LWIILALCAIATFLLVGPPAQDSGEGVVAVKIVNNGPAVVKIAVCMDARCEELADPLTDLNPGDFFLQNAGPNSEQFFAIGSNSESSDGSQIGSRVPGRAYRCAYLDVGADVKDAYSLSSLTPCSS